MRVLFVSFCVLTSLSADLFFFCTLIFLSADLFLLPGLALQVEKQKLSEGIEEMKITVRNSHNRAENWNALWKSFRSVAGLLRTSADDGQSWDQFIPQVPTCFQDFVKRCAQLCTRNVLAQVQVLAPEMPLSKIAEEAESQEYLDAVEKMEPEVEDLARRIVDNLDTDISSPDGGA